MKNMVTCKSNTALCRHIKIGIIAFALLFMLLPKTVYAETQWNGNNYYLGMYYGDSLEHIEELKELIVSDGYICVSEGYGYDEYTEILIGSKDFYWFAHLLNDTEDYLVYVPERTMEWYANGECGSWTLNMSTVCLDYYAFNHSDDMGVKYSDMVGNDNIPDEAPRGTISIQAEVPDLLMTDAYKFADCTITVDLYGNELNNYYSVEISGINDYYYMQTFVADQYRIVDARINNNNYLVQFDDQFHRLNDGESIGFVLTVVDRNAVEEQAISEQSPNREINATLITDLQETTKKNPVPMMIVAVISLGLLILGATQFLNYINRRREDSEYEGEFKKWWIVCIIASLVIPFVFVIIDNLHK